MSSFLVGARLLLTVPVTDKASGALVDPSAVAFRLVAPSTSGYPLGTYVWNGTIWTNSEGIIAVPARASLGTFTLLITLPYANIAQGDWYIGWKTTANGDGLGEGSDEKPFTARPSGALS